MKLCRFKISKIIEELTGREGPAERAPFDSAEYGVVEGDVVSAIEWLSPHAKRTGRTWNLRDVRLLAPVAPSKIVCVGRSYAEHAAELGNEVPKEPLIFLKPPSSVIGPDEAIILPSISKRVDFEGECAVVIGKRLRLPEDSITKNPTDLDEYILGFTCLNDVTARDIQKKDVQFTRGKGFDTFCPIGPVIETEFDVGKFSISTNVNGVRKQFGNASQMLFSVDAIIRWIAQVMTLFPGDVIATGTPPGVGALEAGDVVEVTVSGIGTLRNPVKASSPQP